MAFDTLPCKDICFEVHVRKHPYFIHVNPNAYFDFVVEYGIIFLA
jgi:hypothetical protein